MPLVVKVNTMRCSSDPLVSDQSSSAEMASVYPHRNLPGILIHVCFISIQYPSFMKAGPSKARDVELGKIQDLFCETGLVDGQLLLLKLCKLGQLFQLFKHCSS